MKGLRLAFAEAFIEGVDECRPGIAVDVSEGLLVRIELSWGCADWDCRIDGDGHCCGRDLCGRSGRGCDSRLTGVVEIELFETNIYI